MLNASGEVVGINTWVRDISEIEEKQIGGEKVTVARPAQGLNFAVSARDIREFLNAVDHGQITNLTLKLPNPPGCTGHELFKGRTKANDAMVRVFSMRCDEKADVWLILPDDKSEPKKLLLDTERVGKASVVVISNVTTGKWQTSYWDFFRDETFAVIGRHENGSIKPSWFEFSHS